MFPRHTPNRWSSGSAGGRLLEPRAGGAAGRDLERVRPTSYTDPSDGILAKKIVKQCVFCVWCPDRVPGVLALPVPA